MDTDTAIRIVMLGDVVGQKACDTVAAALQSIRKKFKADFIVINAENVDNGGGLSPNDARLLFESGADCITSGNHIWDRKDYEDLFELSGVLRPINYAAELPGSGVFICERNDKILGVINAQGIRDMIPILNPFDCVKTAAQQLKEKYATKNTALLVDFHAESFGEKEALAWYLDGDISAFIGTHTHVQTADEKILPKGTGYLGDVGMCGVLDAVIGFNADISVERARNNTNIPMTVAEGKISLCGVYLEIQGFACKTIQPFVLPV
ncbi:MAG TPA: TIGR00282 family metallophosphoesterase [Spirochaetales bacterium]|nr:TIGR00282 family metallophosphoesterase [Spirochaetales bacterium]